MKSRVHHQYSRFMGRVAVAFLLFSIVVIISIASSTEGRTVTVGDTGDADFTTIQNAIDNVTDGDEIIVQKGLFFQNIVINKEIVIQGHLQPAIITLNEKPSIEIESNNVTINNIHLLLGTIGIYIRDCTNITITNTSFTHLNIGIDAKLTDGLSIINNTFIGIGIINNSLLDYYSNLSSQKPYSGYYYNFTIETGRAIRIYNSINISINLNMIDSCTMGLSVHSTWNLVVTDNIIMHCKYGMSLTVIDANISNNYIDNCVYGFEDSLGSTYGENATLQRNKLTNNTFSNNTIAMVKLPNIYIEYDNVFINNEIDVFDDDRSNPEPTGSSDVSVPIFFIALFISSIIVHLRRYNKN